MINQGYHIGGYSMRRHGSGIGYLETTPAGGLDGGKVDAIQIENPGWSIAPLDLVYGNSENYPEYNNTTAKDNSHQYAKAVAASIVEYLKVHYDYSNPSIDSNSTGHEYLPAIAKNNSGDYVVAWQDDDDLNGHFNITVRGFNADGSEKFSARQVGASSGNLVRPDVAIDAQGRFVVVWQDDQDLNGFYNIHAAGFDNKGDSFVVNGNTVGDRVISAIANRQKRPAVAMSESSGKFVVTWDDDEDGNGLWEVKARGYDLTSMVGSSGNEYFAETFATIAVNDISSGNQNYSDVAMNANGAFVVAWQDNQDAVTSPKNADSYNIKLAGFTPDGSKVIADVDVSTTKHKLRPAIAMNDNGQFVVAWHDDSNDDNDVWQVKVNGYSIVADNALPFDTTPFSEITINPTSTANQRYPDVAIANDGKFAVTWHDNSNSSETAYDIYTRFFTANGVKDKEEIVFRENIIADNAQYFPTIAMNKSTGEYVVVWADDNDGDGQFEILSQSTGY